MEDVRRERYIYLRIEQLMLCIYSKQKRYNQPKLTTSTWAPSPAGSPPLSWVTGDYERYAF
jgi:hypothetical protein